MACRIPGITSEQLNYLTVWLRSAVAHWKQMDMLHGNECVPTLIGGQGCGKTTFVRRLLPPQLREFYLDHLNLSNKFDKEMALTNNLIANLDELDAISSKQHAKLKQTLSVSKVNGRPIFGRGNGQYYRAHHGEILLSPKQQEDILRIVSQFGPLDGIKFELFIWKSHKLYSFESEMPVGYYDHPT